MSKLSSIGRYGAFLLIGKLRDMLIVVLLLTLLRELS